MERTKPDWWERAKFYYSEIDLRPGPPARLFSPPEDREITPSTPGTLLLSLERRHSDLRVLDSHRQELGVIRSQGFIPAAKYVMYRDGVPVWILSVRSVVRKRQVLSLDGERWTFHTPFFWWHHFMTGATDGASRVIAWFPAPTKTIWGIAIEPGRDSLDLLAAVAFMHRNWLFWYQGP